MKYSIRAPRCFLEVTQMPEYVAELRQAIEHATPVLQEMSEERSRLRPQPDKWCPREVIGHLIDSASNNHQRFVRAQFQEDLVFSGYEQDAWVSVQRYRDAPWEDLITLWNSSTLHSAWLMDFFHKDERDRPRAGHIPDELAWKLVPRAQAATLDYFMRDYV